MSNLIIFLGLVVLAKFTINLSRYLSCNRYQKIYDTYLKKPEWKFEESHHQIVKLFKEAEIEDMGIPYVEYLGFDHIAKGEASVMHNMGVRRNDVAQLTTGMFHRAKGVYRSRMLDAINPLYWLMFIIYLPKNLFQYLGTSPESTIVKIAQLIYWLLAGVASLLVSVFGNEINAYFYRGVFSLVIYGGFMAID